MASPPETGRSGRLVLLWLPLLLIGAVLFVYFGFIYRYALNVPLGDDIYDVLKVIVDVQQAASPGAAFEVLYAQHNDHRTFASRLLYLAVYTLTGEVDFRTLTVLANLALPALLLLLFAACRTQRLRYWIMLPAALLLFQLRAYGLTLWSMAAFAYFYVFLYGFASLYCLHEVNRSRFILGAVFATLATYTLASGQAVWLVGLLSLLQQSLIRKQCSALYALAWIVVAVAVLLAWRVGLETPNTLWAMLLEAWRTPGHHLLYTLSLLGSAASEASVAWAALAGAFMLLALLVSSLHSRGRADIRLELCGWYILLSVMSITLGRAPYSAVEYTLSSRYSFPSTLMLATVWALLALRLNLQSWKSLGPALVASAVYCVSSYMIYAPALQPYVEKRITDYNAGRYWAWQRPMKETAAIVARAEAQGVYSPPARPLPVPHIGGPAPRPAANPQRRNHE